MSASRVVVLLSPIFVGLSGSVVAWIAKHFPGAPQLSPGELTTIFVAGATFAAGKVALWLRGLQKWENPQG